MGCILNRRRLEDGVAGRLSEPAPTTNRVDVPMDTEGRRVPKVWLHTTGGRDDISAVSIQIRPPSGRIRVRCCGPVSPNRRFHSRVRYDDAIDPGFGGGLLVDAGA